MKAIIVFLMSVSISSFGAFKPLPTVEDVDLQKYSGKWYEISRLYQIFQKGCTAVTAEYEVKRTNYIKVINKCRVGTIDGKLKTAVARAWSIDKENNSKLKVQFFLRFVRLPFFAGDYYIIALDDNYEYAMVGAPDRKSLWILSRRPSLDQDTLDTLKTKANELGFDSSKLIMTKH